MNKANKKKLKEAIELLESANELIMDVKMQYHDGKEKNDEYYALEDVEVRIDETIDDLDEYL